MERAKKSFDPTVCFMFFGTWVEAIERFEKLGQGKAYRLFKAIAHYCMFEEIPDFSDDPALWATWGLIEKEADTSIGNRKRQFASDEANEKYEAIIQARRDNPSASVRDLAEKTGSSKSTVDRVLRKYNSFPQTDSNFTVDNATVTILDDVIDNSKVNDTDYNVVADTVNDNDTLGQDSGTVLENYLSPEEEEEAWREYIKEQGHDTETIYDDDDLPF